MPIKNLYKWISGLLLAGGGGLLLFALTSDLYIPDADPGIGPAQFRVILLSLSLAAGGFIMIALRHKVLKPLSLLRRAAAGFIWLEKRYFICVLLLVGANIFLRAGLEQSDQHLYNYYTLAFPDLVKQIDTFPWWNLFIPGYTWEGSLHYAGYYSPFTVILMLYLPTRVGIANTWYLLNTLLIIGSFIVSWFAFRSRVFSYTLCLLLGFGTQLYHVYHMPGTTSVILSFLLYEINLFFILKIFTDTQHKRIWYTLYFIELVFMALYNLSWLDYLAFFWVLSLLLLAYFWYTRKKMHLPSLAYIFITTTFVGVLYILLKLIFTNNQIIATGTEEDVVFNYPYLILAVEDIISNVITNFYLAVSNYLPPFMVGSYSQYLFGSEQLIALQNGYHIDYSYLIPMQHLFFWRYYAGMWFVAFAYLMVRFTIKAFRTASFDHLALTIFLLMTFVGSPTHVFIKARPYMSTPLLAYRVAVGVLGVSLLIAYLVMLTWKKIKNRRLAIAIVVIIWVVIMSGALTRPPYLEFLTTQVGINYGGVGPNPINILSEIFSHLWIQVFHLFGV